MPYLSKLVRHCTWANQLWIDLVSGNVTGDDYLAALMSHILLGERAWFQRIRGEKVDGEVWRVIPTDDMQQVQDEHATIYAELLSGDLERQVAYRRFSGQSIQSSVCVP
jgi:hypothetical protein